MSGGFLGGGIVFAVAALLWILYLVPTWLSRRHFNATERNAVRMQQTIRALAETADVPDEFHVETSARAVIEQRRMLRKAQKAARAEVRAATARAVGYDTTQVRARRRARVTRATSALFLLGALTTVVWGGVALATGSGWEILSAGCAVFAVALVTQEVVVSTTAVSRTTGQGTRNLAAQLGSSRSAPALVTREWTPVPLPKPMHLEQGSIAASVVASQLAAEKLRRAAAEAAVVAATPAVPSVTARLQAMGVVDAPESVALDLDAALRRRRVG
jgi:hypothetical protein